MALYLRQRGWRKNGRQTARGTARQEPLGVVATGGGLALWPGLPPCRRGKRSGSSRGVLSRAPECVVGGPMLSVTREAVAVLYRCDGAQARRRTPATNAETGDRWSPGWWDSARF